MTVSLQQLLADPDLRLEVVAGHAGIGRRDPIRWAHITEIPDPTPWLEGGEIVLTTGLGVKDSPQLQRRLIAGLDRTACPAVGFGVGIWLDEVPAAMLAEADRRGLPLFTVPYEVPFIAVTKYVSRRVFQAHYRGLQRALDLHRRVLSAVTSGGGLEEVLRVTVRTIGEADALVFDAFGRVLARAAYAAAPADADRLWRALPSDRRAGMLVAHKGRVATVTPIRAADEVDAVLVVVSHRELDDAQHLLLEQGVTAAGIELSRGMSTRRQRRATVGEVLVDAIEGRSSAQRLAERLQQLGIDADEPYHVLAVASDAPGTVVCRVVEDAVTDERVAVGVANGLVHAIVQPAAAGLAHAVVAAARARALPPLTVGRSHNQRGVDGVVVGLRESAAAVRRADGGVVDVAELGVEGLLAGIGADAAADAFVTQVLGPVLDHGDDRPGALVDTLRAYLRHGCRPGPAAAELRIHRHTLSYRLDRIAELTGRDPRAGENLLSYGLALELLAQEDAADPPFIPT